MTFKEYQEQAKRTCPSLGSEKLDLAHMVLGIFSEYEEYYNAIDEVNKSEECSDMYWYVANYCTFRGYNLEGIGYVKGVSKDTFDIHLSRLQDYVKKYIAYNKPMDLKKELYALSGICYWINQMYEDMNIPNSLQNNINKLKVRFPQSFNEELAKNRDLVSERKELEK